MASLSQISAAIGIMQRLDAQSHLESVDKLYERGTAQG